MNNTNFPPHLSEEELREFYDSCAELDEENRRKLNEFSPNSIRIAYQWLDAQSTRKTPIGYNSVSFHVIQRWARASGGVGLTDLMVAAHAHPNITGRYLTGYNVSKKRVFPDLRRLQGLENINSWIASTHKQQEPQVFHHFENDEDREFFNTYYYHRQR